MESLAFATLAPSSFPGLHFCSQGGVKCSPVTSSVWTASLSSSKCTSSSMSLLYGEQVKAVKKDTSRINRREVVFVNQFGSENTDAHTIKEEPKQVTNGHATSTRENVLARGSNGLPSIGVTTTSSEPQHLDVDEIWQQIKAEARLESEKEPVLASYFYSSVISHRPNNAATPR